jgi:hypothetical protein
MQTLHFVILRLGVEPASWQENIFQKVRWGFVILSFIEKMPLQHLRSSLLLTLALVFLMDLQYFCYAIDWMTQSIQT